jgi:hypothetical protein
LRIIRKGVNISLEKFILCYLNFEVKHGYRDYTQGGQKPDNHCFVFAYCALAL